MNIKFKRACGLKSQAAFLKVMTVLALAYSITLTPAFSQQIVVDGKTNTTLNVNGNVTTVNTATIKNGNAFNSFSKFNVDTGKVVNLNVPNTANNLINLVSSEQTNINGILNSVKNGHIGGNVYLVNPYGVVVGSQGVVNVGSLSVVTPTKAFVDNFFYNGSPNDRSVNSLLNGTAPVNTEAIISIQGKVNAINNVSIASGSISNAGTIYAGAKFQENNVAIGDVVNVNNLQANPDLAVNNGNIVITAKKEFTNSGKIVADGGNNLNAGNITVNADRHITMNNGSLISAKGKGVNSNGGNILLLAKGNANFNEGAVIDARGGNISGNGGFIELSAKQNVNLNGGVFKANAINGENGTVYIDPDVLNINTNQFSDGANMKFEAATAINIDNAIISTRNVGTGTSGEDVSMLDHMNAVSQGDAGNLDLIAPTIQIINNSKILTFADNNYKSGNINVIADLSNVNSTTDINPDLNALANINDSYMKGGNINFIAKGGYLTNNNPDYYGITEAFARVYAESSIIIGDEIDFHANGGNVNNPKGFGNAEVSAYALACGSVISGKKVSFDARAGNALITTTKPSVSPYITAKSEVTVENSNITGTEKVSFISVGGVIHSDTQYYTAFATANTEVYNAQITGKNIELFAGQGSVLNQIGELTGEKFNYDSRILLDGTSKLTLNNPDVNISFAPNADLTTKVVNLTEKRLLTLKANNIGGGGTLELVNQHRNININNYSNANLEIKDINTLADALILVNDVPTMMNSLLLDLNIQNSNDYAPKTVNILNGSASDVILTGVINTNGNVVINNALGDILTGTDNLIYAKNLNMEANNGVIGSMNIPVKTDIFFTGSVNLAAKGLINLEEVQGDLQVNSINSIDGDVNITAKGSIVDIKADESVNISGKNITLISKTASIGPINDLDIICKGVLNATATQGMINISQLAGDLYLGQIKALEDVYLNSAGGIYTYSRLPVINISGANINLTAATAIVTTTNPIEVDSSTNVVNTSAPNVYIHKN